MASAVDRFRSALYSLEEERALLSAAQSSADARDSLKLRMLGGLEADIKIGLMSIHASFSRYVFETRDTRPFIKDIERPSGEGKLARLMFRFASDDRYAHPISYGTLEVSSSFWQLNTLWNIFPEPYFTLGFESAASTPLFEPPAAIHRAVSRFKPPVPAFCGVERAVSDAYAQVDRITERGAQEPSYDTRRALQGFEDHFVRQLRDLPSLFSEAYRERTKQELALEATVQRAL